MITFFVLWWWFSCKRTSSGGYIGYTELPIKWKPHFNDVFTSIPCIFFYSSCCHFVVVDDDVWGNDEKKDKIKIFFFFIFLENGSCIDKYKFFLNCIIFNRYYCVTFFSLYVCRFCDCYRSMKNVLLTLLMN